MSRELRICPGVGGRKCGAFLSRLDRDPHPTCTRCRGKVCTKDLTCDFCAVWSAEQWELFAKKGRNALQALFPLLSRLLPARKLLREFRALGLLLLLLPALQAGRRRGGGGLGVHLVLCLVGLPLLPLNLGPARGVGVPLGIRLARAGSLPLLLLLREEEERELPARCRRPFPASPRLLTLPNSHRTFHDVRIRGSHQSLAPAIHAPRGVDRGRIRGLGHVRVARVDVAVALALAPLPVRGQEVVSVGSGHRPRHSLLVSAHAVSGRGLLTATALGVEALGRVVTGLDPRIWWLFPGFRPLASSWDVAVFC